MDKLKRLQEQVQIQEDEYKNAERTRLSLLARLQKEEGDDREPEPDVEDITNRLAGLLHTDVDSIAEHAMRHHKSVIAQEGDGDHDGEEANYFAVRRCLQALAVKLREGPGVVQS
eukprot:1593218-Alexandrium_andersonii.AAC.1